MNAAPAVNHILWLANREKTDITPLKMQKLLYFLHGWYLAITDEALIDEPFMKWQYGPVVPSVYQALRKYGSSPINDYILESPFSREPLFVNTAAKPQFMPILEQVWGKYSKFSATQLSTMTHEPHSPWDDAVNDQPIDNTHIRDYFVDQVYSRGKLKYQHNV